MINITIRNDTALPSNDTYDAAGRLTAIAGVKGNVSYGQSWAGGISDSIDYAPSDGA